MEDVTWNMKHEKMQDKKQEIPAFFDACAGRIKVI